MIGLAILLTAAAAAYVLARWMDATPLPFLLIGGVALARLEVFPVELLQDVVALGLAFVLFVAGTELSPRRMRQQRAAAFSVGIMQFAVIGIAAFALALLLGMDQLTALYVGLALAASSTLVIVRLLQRRRQLFEPFGRMVVGVLLLQDLLLILTIPLLTYLPSGALAVVRGLLGTIALVGLAWVTHRYVAPLLLRLRLEAEVLLLSVLGVLALFIGLANFLELPLVAGAFLAGIGMSAFPLRGILRPQLSSLGEFFSAIFFIALGGLLQTPSAAELVQVLAFTLLVVGVTPPLVAVLAQRAGLPARAATEAGLMLAQTSELSLVLALQGMLLGHLTQDVFTVLALVTVITMVITPAVSSQAVMERAMRLQPVPPSPATEAPHGHVLLLGCGSGGMPLLETLFAGGEDVVVIEDDPRVVDRLRRGDVHTIRGDAAQKRTLLEAGASQARIISSTIRRPRDNQALLEMVHSDVPVLVRVFDDDDADWVRAMGGTPIVYSAAAAEDFLVWFDRSFGPEHAERSSETTERGPPASGM